MAKQKVFAPFDAKLKIWMQPMFFQHAGQAERVWKELSENPESIVCKHKEDFSLFQIGEYEDETGLLTPLPVPVFLIDGQAQRQGRAPEHIR